MTASDREELQAALAARRELGREYEPALVDSFLERVEKQLERRSGGVGQREHRMVTPLILGSLGLAIPLLAIASAAAACRDRAGLRGDRERERRRDEAPMSVVAKGPDRAIPKP